MWSAFEVLATNKTPATNGHGFNVTSSGGHVTYSSSPPPPVQRPNTRGPCTHAMGSASNPLIINVDEVDRDPFCENESHWPLRHYEEVYMVTTTFSTQDPPLLTPLLTSRWLVVVGVKGSRRCGWSCFCGTPVCNCKPKGTRASAGRDPFWVFRLPLSCYGSSFTDLLY